MATEIQVYDGDGVRWHDRTPLEAYQHWDRLYEKSRKHYPVNHSVPDGFRLRREHAWEQMTTDEERIAADPRWGIG